MADGGTPSHFRFKKASWSVLTKGKLRQRVASEMKGRMKRITALVLAYLCLALAIIGLYLPVWPTVPFLLLSAWFSARGSERLHRWLYSHPRFGKLLIDWEREGAISRRSKLVSVVLLAVSWCVLFLLNTNVWILVGVAVLHLLVTLFIITRPEPVK